MVDEDGNALSLNRATLDGREDSVLVSGSRMDVGGWQLHLKLTVLLEKEYAGLRARSFSFFMIVFSAGTAYTTVPWSSTVLNVFHLT